MKVAWFDGDCRNVEPANPPRSMDEIIASTARRESRFSVDFLYLVLVPDDTDLTKLYGDDWDDAPASCNAGAPYKDSLPEGSVVLSLNIGDPFPWGQRD